MKTDIQLKRMKFPFLKKALHKCKTFIDFTLNKLKRHREPQSGAVIQNLCIYRYGARKLGNNTTASSPLASRKDELCKDLLFKLPIPGMRANAEYHRGQRGIIFSSSVFICVHLWFQPSWEDGP